MTTRRMMIAGAASASVTALISERASARSIDADWSGVDRIAQAAVAARVTPGVQIAVYGRDGPWLSKGYGLADLQAGTPVTPDSVFRIGSVMKEFTAAVVLRLADLGRLSLNDRLDRHLPTAGAAGAVTLAQLVGHTSGLNNYTSAQTAEAYLQNARLDRTTTEMVGIVLAMEPLFLFEPGTDWAYSNSNYVLLGAVIEAVAGLPLQQAFKTLLFDPLSLAGSAVDDAAEIVPGRAAGYVVEAEASTGFANAPFAAMSYAGASGSMRSTAADLCRWRAALLAGQVLSPGMLETLTSPTRLAEGKVPEAVSDDGRRSQILYGGGVYLDPIRGQRALRGGGGIQGFVAICDSLIEPRISWAVLTNVDGNGATGLGALHRDVQREILRVIGS